MTHTHMHTLPSKNICLGSSHRSTAEMNLTRNHEVAGLIPGLPQWVKDLVKDLFSPMRCGAGCRCSSDLSLLWLWYRPAAVALIRPLAWEPPHAKGVALKVQKKKKNNPKNICLKIRMVLRGL